MLEFDVSPATVSGTNIPLTVSQLILQRRRSRRAGRERPDPVRNLADVEGGEALAFALGERAQSRCARAAASRSRFRRALRVRLAVYGVDGRCVRTLVDGTMEPGRHDATWDGRDARGAGVDAGIYFVRLVSGGRSLSRKLVVISSRRS